MLLLLLPGPPGGDREKWTDDEKRPAIFIHLDRHQRRPDQDRQDDGSKIEHQKRGQRGRGSEETMCGVKDKGGGKWPMRGR